MSSVLHHQSTKLQSPVLKGPSMPKLKRKMSLDICSICKGSIWLHACHALQPDTFNSPSSDPFRAPAAFAWTITSPRWPNGHYPLGSRNAITSADKICGRSSLGELEFPEGDHLLRCAH